MRSITKSAAANRPVPLTRAPDQNKLSQLRTRLWDRPGHEWRCHAITERKETGRGVDMRP